MTIFTLAVPFVSPAQAQVSGDNTFGLEVSPETDTNATGTNHTLTATLYNQTVTGNTGDTNVATCNRAAGCEVDFEIETGPAVTVVSETPDADPGQAVPRTTDADDSEASPDAQCLIANGASSCSVVISSATAGTNQIRAWVDDDRNNTTQDFDPTEGRNAGNSDCVSGTPNPSPVGFTADTLTNCTNTGSTAGDRSERDDTDVVSKDWFTGATNVVLDCDDETTTNETQGGGSQGNDTQTNPAGQSEIYTCTALDTKGTAALTDDTAVNGAVIDAENEAGANDIDNSSAAGTADYNNACTTANNGTCTFTLNATDNETGSADVCFWIDEDLDTAYDPAGSEADGGECDTEATSADEGTSSARATNKTDQVTKTWASPAAASQNATPEVDNNASGTTHTVSTTMIDQFGNPIANQPVDFTITSGRNVALGTLCNDVLTNASGIATCTYTDAGTASSSGTDTIRVTREGTAADGTEARDEVATPGGTAEPDLTDIVAKIWTAGGPPAAASVIVDMLPGAGVTDCDDAADSADTQEVGLNNPICGFVASSTGTGIAGATVTLTYTGAGGFGSDANANGELSATEDQGTSITVTTDEVGRWDATLFSTDRGTGTVTATAGSVSDTGTKTWTTPAAGARVIDCTPEDADNPPGTEHVITCLVTDRYGNPVTGVSVTPSESGPGRLESSAAATTGTDGTVEFVVSSTVNESGTQTFTGELTSDVGDTDVATTDTDDPCDQVAGTVIAAEPGTTGTQTGTTAPAGVCEDSTTKNWTDEPPVGEFECNDGVDNDNDGNIDFPDDPGCNSATDDSEISETPRPCRVQGSGANVIVGTSGADVLTGTPDRDVICGAGGDDVISARGGPDLVVGNGGADTIGGGGGKDNLSGNGDNDSISGNRGNDAIKGQRGGDTLKGNKGIDSLTGGKGSDSLQGGNHDDILKGGAGNDTLRGGKGDDLLNGGDGTDLCFGNAGNDRIRGCE